MGLLGCDKDKESWDIMCSQTPTHSSQAQDASSGHSVELAIENEVPTFSTFHRRLINACEMHTRANDRLMRAGLTPAL